MLIVGLYRIGKHRTQKKGILTNYGVVAGRIEPVKNADYSDVNMGASRVFNPRTQLKSYLIASCEPLDKKTAALIGTADSQTSKTLPDQVKSLDIA